MKIFDPICFFCKHYDIHYLRMTPREHRQGHRCTAFPEGIPREIIESNYDHRLPHPDDNGIQFAMYESRDTLHPALLQEPPELLDGQTNSSLALLARNRQAGFALPPIVEDGDLQKILQKLLEAKAKYATTLEKWDSQGISPFFPVTLLDKLIAQATEKLSEQPNNRLLEDKK